MYFNEDIAMLTPSELFLPAAGFPSGLIKNAVGLGTGLALLPTFALVSPANVALGLGPFLLLPAVHY